MKRTLYILLAGLLAVAGGCTTEDNYVPEVPDDKEENAEINVVVNMRPTYNINGVNISCRYTQQGLKVGDDFVLELDSTNDPAPKVTVCWKGEDVQTYEELPATFTETQNEAGEFELVIKVESGDVYFELPDTVIIK